MQSKNLLRYSLFLSAIISVLSCQSLQPDAVSETYLDLPAEPYQYNNFNDPTNTISTLGRVLFYDPQLSLNNSTSCASCHKQSAGFADNQKFSRGFESRFTSRNSMPIQNLASFNGFFEDTGSSPNFTSGNHFFWDGREQDLQKLILQPVGNHIEMGITDIDALAAKLSVRPHYQTLFNEAFGSPEINADKISIAVTSFITSITTNNTKFDRYNQVRFDPNLASQTDFSSLELEGMMLFETKYDCNACHQVQSPNGYIFAGTFANIGLDDNYQDPGLQNVTGNAADNGKFKIPSLRNVSFTAPYMHDGRFSTLEEVVDHYSEGLANHPNLDPKLQDGGGNARKLSVTDHEKDALIAFLHTLSDVSALSDPKFSNPFKVKK